MPFPLIPYFSISLRSSAGSPTLVARAVTAALTTVDHDLTFVFPPHLLADQVNGSLTQERLVGLLSGCFGALALLLAALGLYGVTSHAVNRRRPEIGIRMALGRCACHRRPPGALPRNDAGRNRCARRRGRQYLGVAVPSPRCSTASSRAIR